jgi:hypothetical protein
MLAEGPPGAQEPSTSGPDDVLLPHWEGKTVIDESAAASRSPGEWLLVEAWDES